MCAVRLGRQVVELRLPQTLPLPRRWSRRGGEAVAVCRTWTVVERRAAAPADGGEEEAAYTYCCAPGAGGVEVAVPALGGGQDAAVARGPRGAPDVRQHPFSKLRSSPGARLRSGTVDVDVTLVSMPTTQFGESAKVATSRHALPARSAPPGRMWCNTTEGLSEDAMSRRGGGGHNAGQPRGVAAGTIDVGTRVSGQPRRRRA